MSDLRDTSPKPYGTVAEFDSPEALLEAAKRASSAGYKKLETYSPIPVHGMEEVLDFKDVRLGWLVFLAGLGGAVAGLALQVYVSAIDYPLNVGGKPYVSLPSFVPVIFECTVLFAAGTATVGLFLLNGLPKPHHPMFNASQMHRASQDRFLLCIEAEDPQYDVAAVEGFLKGLSPLSVEAIETSEGY